MSLNVENCSRCGKIHLKNNYGLCHNCIKDIENQYESCLNFLRENRECTIQQLSESTGVPIKQIMKFIREGRISIKNNPNMAYECDVCGSPIRENNLCEPCRSRLLKEAKNMQEDELRKKEQAKTNQHGYYVAKNRLQDRTKS